jgi:hypothetical protein
MNNTPDIIGTYRHYKGHEYEVLGAAVHTETEERLIVYRDIHKPELMWVRPYDMFFEEVMVDGNLVPRFVRTNSSRA